MTNRGREKVVSKVAEERGKHIDHVSSFLVNTQFGVGRHWWFNYPGSLLNAKFEFACLSN